MAQSLWAIPEIEKVRSPKLILSEQAGELQSQTNGKLKGRVELQSNADRITLILSIVVPGLNNYKLDLISYQQPVEMYPGTIRASLQQFKKEIQNEQDFVDTLAQILSSDKTKSIIAALLAQT